MLLMKKCPALFQNTVSEALILTSYKFYTDNPDD